MGSEIRGRHSGGPERRTFTGDPAPGGLPEARLVGRESPEPRGAGRPAESEAVARAVPWLMSVLFHAGLGLVMVLVALIVFDETKETRPVVPDVGRYDEAVPMRMHRPTDSPSHVSRASSADLSAPWRATGTDEIRPAAVRPLALIGLQGPSPGRDPLGFPPAGVPGPATVFLDRKTNARHVVYVIDRSGSMVDTFDVVRWRLAESIGQLDLPQDFHVILFAEGAAMESPPRRLVPATKANRSLAAEFLEAARPSGRTDPIPAIRRAMAVLNAAGDQRGKVIWLLTDGMFEDGEAVLRLIAGTNADKNVSIFTFLYGHRPPEAVRLMSRIAEENNGQFRYVSPDE